MLSAKAKRKLLQIIPFGVISAMSGLVFSLIEEGVLGDHPIYPSTGNPYHFNPIVTTILGLVAGLIIGSLEILLLRNLFDKSSFIKKIAAKTIVYVLLISIIILFVSVTDHALEMKRSLFDPQALTFAFNFFNNFAFLSVGIFVAFGIGFALFYTEITDNIGLGVLLNFFTGKYHRPKEEARIFMFLDMKDSTTIAEKLGHVRYFEMLREYYADLTQPIIDHAGEIYQYVGDEVVVTWKQEKGIAQNNCIHCFFDMKQALSRQANKYRNKYGLAPTFKAGMHLGQVTTGEIGVIKKDIVYTGDVLNTTARIQGLCNQYKTDLLVSEQLINAMQLMKEFECQSVGENELRGRNETVRLYTVGYGGHKKPVITNDCQPISTKSPERILKTARTKVNKAYDLSKRAYTFFWIELDTEVQSHYVNFISEQGELGYLLFKEDDENWTLLSSHRLVGKCNGKLVEAPLKDIEKTEFGLVKNLDNVILKFEVLLEKSSLEFSYESNGPGFAMMVSLGFIRNHWKRKAIDLGRGADETE